MNSDFAWLVFDLAKKDRYGRDAWVKRQPVGTKVINEILGKSGIVPDTCSVQSAKKYQVVLVSLTSAHDVLAFYSAVALHPDWKPGWRKFKVVAGGYGMQNPYPLRDFVDYAYFGRAEAHIVDLVQVALDGRPSGCHSVMHLPDIHNVQVQQAVTLYDGMIYQEQFTGCPLKCKFCHYTFARKHKGGDHAYSKSLGTAGAYVQATGHSGKNNSSNSIEVTWPQLLKWPHARHYTQVTAAIDGPSERLRFLFGKRIADEDIPVGVNRYLAGARESGIAGFKLQIYDIAGLPGELPEDRGRLSKLFEKVNVYDDCKAVVVIHVTPFKPSPWTPMGWEAASLYNWSRQLAGKTIVEPMLPTRKIVYSQFIESPAAQILDSIISRHDGSKQAREAMHAVAFNPRFKAAKSDQKLRLFQNTWPKFSAFAMGELPLDAKLPTECARPSVGHDTLRKIAHKMRSDMEISARDVHWRRGHETIGSRVGVLPASSPD